MWISVFDYGCPIQLLLRMMDLSKHELQFEIALLMTGEKKGGESRLRGRNCVLPSGPHFPSKMIVKFPTKARRRQAFWCQEWRRRIAGTKELSSITSETPRIIEV